MRLIVLHGAPGVGKLTVGRELQDLTGYRLFHNHLAFELGLALFPAQSMAFRELRERVWLDAIGTAAREDVNIIFTLVFEPTLLPGFYQRLVSVVEANGGTVHPFELQCEPAENARRVVQPDRRAFSKETNPEFLLSARASGAYDPPPGLPNNTVIDTTHLSADETANRIYAALSAPMR